VKAAGVLAAIAIAVALQTTLARFVISGTVAIDLVTVVVVFVGLMAGPTTGMLAGTCGGLVQDALSSGIIGIGGLAKTIVGFLTGVIGTLFIVARPLPRFVVFFLASLLHAVVFLGLYVLLDLRPFDAPYTGVMSQAAANAAIGTLVCQLSELLPGAVEKRRSGRGMKIARRLD
jgi:rod shape-determining protein MreD